ncbi:MAG TPA: hypothetical protein VFJ47_05830 [Terriglobales bacterium]|nr:hypothetical protein [Terriglobales bacterium]
MRKLLGTPAILLLLASVIGWSVQALAAAPQSDRENRSEKPSQSQPAPDQGTVQGSQTPSATQAAPQNPAPSQATPPSQTSPGSNAPAARTPGQATSIEDELQLTPDQKQKISTIVDDENRQIGAVREDQSLTMDQKIQKVQEIRKVGAPKIKAVLTPEQLQKLAAIQERARQQQGQQDNQAAPPPKQ